MTVSAHQDLCIASGDFVFSALEQFERTRQVATAAVRKRPRKISHSPRVARHGTFVRMESVYQPFPHTHWSLIRRAGHDDDAVRRLALKTLLERYQPALRSYLRVVRKMPPHAADDLLQSFIADKVLEAQLLRHADESRGRFRTFLLTCLTNYTTTRHRSSELHDPKTNGQPPSEATSSNDPSPHATVEAAWARALVRDVLATMQEECRSSNREDLWIVFESRVLAEIYGSQSVVPYEALAERLKLTSPTQAANLLVTAKRMYARLLRSAVAEYERDDAGMEAEIAELREILAQGPADA